MSLELFSFESQTKTIIYPLGETIARRLNQYQFRIVITEKLESNFDF